MKKHNLFMVSLIAIMVAGAAGAARADIASTKYVDDKISPVNSAIEALDDTIGGDFTTDNTVAAAIGANASAINTLNGNAETTGSVRKLIADNAVNTVVTGSVNGTIAVDGSNVAVAGLGSAAYTNSNAYDAAGSASTAQSNAATYTDNKIGALGSRDVSGVDTPYNVKDYVDAKVAAVSGDVDALGALASKDEVAESDLTTELANKINAKADSATTLAGYGITDAYTKTQADAAFDAAGAAAAAQSAAELYADGLAAGKQNTITSTAKLNADLVDDSTSTNKFVTATEKTAWSGKQDAITNSAKLDADLVDDSTSTNKFVTASEKTAWSGKQDAISDLATIRSGAAAGATALQSNSALNGANLTNGTVAKAALASDVQTSLGKADSALQSHQAITEGSANGTIAVAGSDVAVHGLGSAAYTSSDAYAPSSMEIPSNITASTLTDGNYVLTAKVVNGNITYGWENIGRVAQ